MNGSLTLNSPHKNFEGIKKVDEFGIEYWEARELMPLLEYTDWRNFNKVILKAQEACSLSKQIINYHFVEVSKMIIIATGTLKEATRRIHDFKLSRYACYLIAQNGDSSNKNIAGIMPEELPIEPHIKKLESIKRKQLKNKNKFIK